MKSLFFDIDGTLVSIKTHRIPDSTVKALEEAKKQGHKVFIATGRPIAILNNVGQIEHLVDGYVTTNGAHCFIGDDVVHTSAMSREEVDIVLDDAKRNDYPVILCSANDIAVFNYKNVIDDIFVKSLDVDLDKIMSVEEMLATQQITQLTPFCNAEQEALLMPRLPNCVSGRWHPAFSDITSREAGKDNGITAIANYLGIDIADTIAFGDGGNDIPMIRKAGIGVAMGNAGDNVKAVADFITTDVDDNGIANALNHLL